MIRLESKQNCCGCYACENICPKQCIKMELDEEGFRYPVIDIQRCISCGACNRVCPILNKKEQTEAAEYPFAVACKNTNQEIRNESSSGGIFPLLADWIIQNGGCVFGAAYDFDFSVHHTMVNEQDKVALLQKSKYVQSRIEHSYQEAKKILDTGKYVLFSGTPCQISGLYHFLGRDYDKLYTTDIACHGVPPENVWKEYLLFLEKKYKSKIIHVDFRNKQKGWKNYCLFIEFENKKTYQQVYYYDIYMRSFVKNVFLRPSCYACSYKGFSYESNLTLADYWGVWKEHPEMDDDKGISLVIVKNQKGSDLLEKIAGSLEEKKVNLEVAVRYNPSIMVSSSQNSNREQFFSDIKKKNVKGCLMRASGLSEVRLLKERIKQVVKR